MLHAAAPWFPTPEACLGGFSGNAIIGSAIAAALLWLALRALSALIGEYVKRAWFSEWRDELKRTQANLRLLEADVAAERAQYAAEREMLGELIAENDRLLASNIRLSVLLSVGGVNSASAASAPALLNSSP